MAQEKAQSRDQGPGGVVAGYTRLSAISAKYAKILRVSLLKHKVRQGTSLFTSAHEVSSKPLRLLVYIGPEYFSNLNKVVR